MATQETQHLDDIISSRRALILGGGALASLVLAGSAKAQSTTAINDTDILNFALNLEYLEANFYTIAASGVNIASSSVPGGAIGITGTGTQGSVTVAANAPVPFSLPLVNAYALETAMEERLHVTTLRNALSTAAVAQPALDLQNSFATLGAAIGVPTFNPFADDYQFLLGSYIFEDVGVSAYHGAAPLITDKVNVLPPAVGIHAVEAYHAGLIRTTLYQLDQNTTPLGPAGTLRALATMISNLRTTFDGTSGGTHDDLGLGYQSAPLNGNTLTATTILNVDAHGMGWARTPTQVLGIVYASTAAPPIAGGFFPAGLNGTIK